MRSMCFAGLVLILSGMSGVAAAQGRSSCQAPQRPSLGGAFGRSSPDGELERGAVALQKGESVSVDAGNLLAIRADASVVGPLRVRV
jgi:hypothetical protein